MVMKAELPDGRTLEFPDGTDPGVIQGKVKELLGVTGGVPSTAPPETPVPAPAGPSPILTPSARAVSPASVAAMPGQGPVSVGEATVGEAPQVLGGIAGGLAAGSVSPALAPAAAGVALGAGFGESMKQIGQHLSGSPDAPVTSMEAAKRIGKAALTEAGFELVGGLVAKGFGKILAPFTRTVKEGVGEAMGYFKDKIQPVLLPAEATESRVLDILHNVSEASIIGGNQVAKYKTDRLKFFDDFADSMIDQFGARTSPDDLGELFVSAVEAKKKVHAEAANVLYNKVSDLVGSKPGTEIVGRRVVTPQGVRFVDEEVATVVPGVEIPTESLKKFAQGIRTHTTELGGIEAKNAGDDLLASVVDLPDNLSFEAAKELRSRLISRVDEFSVINKKAPAIGKAKRMINLIDKQITDSLKDVPKSPVKITAGDYELPKNDIVVVVNHDNLDKTSTTIGGKPINEEIKGGLYHGSSYDFDELSGNNIFLSENAEGATSFASWSSYSSGDTSNLTLYEVKKDRGKTLIVNKKKHPEMFSPDNDPSDDAARRFLDDNPEYKFVKWENVNDGGIIQNVWFTNNPKNVSVSKKHNIQVLEDEFGDVDIDSIVKIEGGESPLEAWRTANRFYKEGQEKFNNTFLRRLIKLADDTGTGPENIAPAIFKPGQVSKVRKTKRALGAESQDWQKMKGFFVQHLMSKSTDVDGRIVGKRILNNLSGKPNSFGDPLLREVLTPPQLREIRMFAKVLESAQAKQAEGAGRMLIQLTQAGAIGAIASGNLEIPAATIVLGPAVLSKLMLNPTTARILTTGISTPASAGAAAGIMSRIIAASERIHRRTEEE